MHTANSRRPEKGALEIIEEAGQLLRLAPVGIFFSYYLGTLPFVLGFLFFVIDMSCNGAARLHLVQMSLVVAVLFVWMKCWQAVFASRLRAFLEDSPQPAWKIGRILRLVCIQTTVVPWLMICLPLALLIALPFGWVYAFFQNMAIFGDGEQGLKASLRSARQQALLWSGQNHKIILIFLLFTIIVFLNVCMAAWLIPLIFRTFLGVETVFSRNSLFFLNTTFLLAMACVTYLCVNPLVRAAYVLRCFYGESLSSGRDLLSEWRRIRRCASQALVLIIVIPTSTMFFHGIIHATPGIPDPRQTSVSAGPAISPEELDSAISDVIGGVEYSWRFPHHQEVEESKDAGFVGQVLDTVGRWLKRIWGWSRSAVEWFLEWLAKLVPDEPAKPSTGFNLFGNVRLWLTILLVTVVLAAIWLLRAKLLRGKTGPESAGKESAPVLSGADLSDENASADQLPEARWLALARDLLNQGELRLALRAFYFAALTHLAAQNLLTLSRFKSNRDYEREIRRRAHAFPGLINAFAENVVILERSWYGMHGVRQEAVRQFLDNYKRITANEQGR
jgi:hypothetical protein